jgi:sulfur-carrier protein adenylyltransferase/sulfurtransferase
MGSLQATEVVKILLGRGTPLVGRLLVYDALDLRFQELRFRRRADCAVCGDSPRITSLTSEPGPEPDMIEEWTATELKERLAEPGAGDLALVDVREPQEWVQGRIEGSLHIPLGSLPQRFQEIPADKLLVFICAAGARSMAACRFAAQNGREAVNLAGGIYGWTDEFGPPPLP